MVNSKSLKKALRSYKKSLKKRNNAERAAYMKSIKFNNAGKTKRKRKRKRRKKQKKTQRGGKKRKKQAKRKKKAKRSKKVKRSKKKKSGCMCTGH